MTNDTQRKVLLLVDGHAYAYRAFHAIQRLSSPTGQPTNAIYGFIKMLQRLRALLQPTHVAVIWDGGLASIRLTELPGYKAQRPPMPTDLEQQLDEINRYLSAAGVASLCQDGVEADDWIAAVARRAEAASWRVIIASSDKDFMQLVSPQISLFNPNDKSEILWEAAKVREKTGVNPGQIVEWLSLIGDAVDNIPGVPGVGPKTATALLQGFGTVAALYERIEEVPSEKLREKLRAAKADVERNLRLIRLALDVVGEQPIEDFRPREESFAELLKLYETWGFNTLRKELQARQPQQGNLL